MADEERHARFLRGEWPGSFRLDLLSLYHFMPITHVGFDYVETSHDTLSAFRNFITYCTWVFGDHWKNSFDEEITGWAIEDPWSQTRPWIIHMALEKAIAGWILECHQDASLFHYKDVSTSWIILEENLERYLDPDHLDLLEKTYDHTLSKQVVYPSKQCVAPPQIPAVRAAPRFGNQGSPTNTVSLPITGVPPLPLPPAKDIPRDPPKDIPTDPNKKRKVGEVVEAGKLNVGTPAPRFCHANLAHVFRFAMENEYKGACTTPESPTSCSGGIHCTSGSLPSVAAVIKSLTEIKSRSAFCEELLVAIKKHHD
jgi:hypothetical protein